MKSSKIAAIAVAAAPFCAFAQEAVPAETAVPASAPETVAAPAETAVPAEAKGEKRKIVIELPELPAADDIKIKISGVIQAQYVYATTGGDGHAKDRNGFSVRRTTLGATVDAGNGWGGKVVYEFDSGTAGGDSYSDYIDTAVITKKIDEFDGTLTVGHKKTHFMTEEYTPSSKLLCIERSLNSNFVNGNTYARGLSGYHIGVFWEGKIDEATDYGISLTNAVAKDYDKTSNDLAVTGNIGRKFALGNDASVYIGVNATVNFGDDGNAEAFGSTSDTALTNAGTVYGIEPYVQFTSGAFSATAECYYINGDDDSKIDAFYGVNLSAAYRFPCGFEPTVRFTYLNTDSGVVNASTQNRVPSSSGHNNATTYFIGANYYFGKHVKLANGYEYGHYFGGNAGQADSGAFRSMLQIVF